MGKVSRRPESAAEITERLIQHAVIAGSCRAWARAEPLAVKGLTKAADLHSAQVRRLADELARLG